MSNQNIQTSVYAQKVDLLLRLLPLVMEEKVFAVHGGTAINLFLRNLPRYSVDIDLTYIPLADRKKSIDDINFHLKLISEKARKAFPGMHIIPNYFPIILVIIRILCFLYELVFTGQALEYLISSLLGCFACFIMLMIAGKISKGGIGYGDVKLISALGLMCGLLKVFTSLLISLVLCLIVSLLLVIMKKKTTKDFMSFGPYIYFGFLLVLIFNIS